MQTRFLLGVAVSQLALGAPQGFSKACLAGGCLVGMGRWASTLACQPGAQRCLEEVLEGAVVIIW